MGNKHSNLTEFGLDDDNDNEYGIKIGEDDDDDSMKDKDNMKDNMKDDTNDDIKENENQKHRHSLTIINPYHLYSSKLTKSQQRTKSILEERKSLCFYETNQNCNIDYGKDEKKERGVEMVKQVANNNKTNNTNNGKRKYKNLKKQKLFGVFNRIISKNKFLITIKNNDYLKDVIFYQTEIKIMKSLSKQLKHFMKINYSGLEIMIEGIYKKEEGNIMYGKMYFIEVNWLCSKSFESLSEILVKNGYAKYIQDS